MEKDQLSRLIGHRLKKLRHNRGWSLDTLASHSGVSKPMLGQIERGESNPTVSTLWKVANGLNVSFSAFLEEQQPSVKVIRYTEIESIIDHNGAFQVFPLFPKEINKPFELYTVQLSKACKHLAEAHPSGVEEYLLVHKGEVTIELSEEVYKLEKGDGIHFLADQQHAYVNHNETEDCVLTILIFYPTKHSNYE